MFLAIPTGTDAPIYHRPYATVALIVLNVAALLAVPPREGEERLGANGEVVEVKAANFERYALTLGDGLHPVQWVTHNFLHYGVIHLAGNMLFLWAFGIVAEGKLGAAKYLALFLAIGTLHGAFTQALMLRAAHQGQAAGASAVVFGLLAVCMVWAPRNEVSCTVFLWVFYRVHVYHWELYYTTVALFYVGDQFLNLVFRGLVGETPVSELGHLSGLLWGSVLAVAMLKAGWVDCEGWDIFSLLAKRRKLAHDWKKRGERLGQSAARGRRVAKGVARPEPEINPEDRAAAAVVRVRKLIDRGDIDAALGAYDKAARTLVSWPSQPDLYALIKAMHARNAEVDSIPMMRDHCRYYPDRSAKVRLKLAQVLIRDRQRPAAAMRVLGGIAPGTLSIEMEVVRLKLFQQAERMQAEGVLELEGDD